MRTGQAADEFLSKTKWQRFQVLIMGPVMNILLALVLTAVVLYQGVEKGAYEDQPPIVGVVAAGLAGAPTPDTLRVGGRGWGVDPGGEFPQQLSPRGQPPSDPRACRPTA